MEWSLQELFIESVEKLWKVEFKETTWFFFSVTFAADRFPPTEFSRLNNDTQLFFCFKYKKEHTQTIWKYKCQKYVKIRFHDDDHIIWRIYFWDTNTFKENHLCTRDALTFGFVRFFFEKIIWLLLVDGWLVYMFVCCSCLLLKMWKTFLFNSLGGVVIIKTELVWGWNNNNNIFSL